MITRRTDPDTLAAFASDESGLCRADHIEAVYYPQSTPEVAELLAQATAERRPVTVSGGGTGVNGGRVATSGGWVVSTEELRKAAPRSWERIEREVYGRTFALELDTRRREAWVAVGVPMQTLTEMLPPGVVYPPDPTEMTAFLGGTLATNASGARSFHYGATREWVQGLTVVLPEGEVLQVERGQVTADDGVIRFADASGREHLVPLPDYVSPAIENASGLYRRPGMDLVDLFVGSEGVLGVITEARLRLAPTPEEVLGEIAFFATESDALAFVDTLRSAHQAGTLPVLSLEFLDERSLRFTNHPVSHGKSYGAAVHVEISGGQDTLDPLLEALENHNYVDDWSADTPQDIAEQKEFRHLLPEGINQYLREHNSQKLGTDFVVPAARFAELMAAYHEAGQQFRRACPREGEHYVLFGHAGDYHLHLNFLTHTPEELAVARRLYVGLARQVVAMGGVISGEHGVGKKTVEVEGQCVPYLELMLGRESLLQIARTKMALDPAGILNVGNMVPAEYLREARGLKR